MRIISGKYGKRRFPITGGFDGRPTTDIAKEGLFNILENRLDWEATRFLDLFAGSGSIGFEALSRGASEVLAVEKNPRHVAYIKSVEDQLGDSHHRVLMRDAYKFINEADRYGTFDFIFADPPYDMPTLPELPTFILDSSLLAPGGCLVIEHPKGISFSDHDNFTECRHYGSVHFSFFAK